MKRSRVRIHSPPVQHLRVPFQIQCPKTGTSKGRKITQFRGRHSTEVAVALTVPAAPHCGTLDPLEVQKHQNLLFLFLLRIFTIFLSFKHSQLTNKKFDYTCFSKSCPNFCILDSGTRTFKQCSKIPQVLGQKFGTTRHMPKYAKQPLTLNCSRSQLASV